MGLPEGEWAGQNRVVDMHAPTRIAVLSVLVGLALGLGLLFASQAEVVWDRDGAGLLGGTLALAGGTLVTLSALGGMRSALHFMAGTLAISWLAEVVGLKGGWLFGSGYGYAPGLWPLLPGGVPLMIPLAWFVLAGLPVLMLGGRKESWISKAAWSALGMVACDLALDPVAVSLGLWTWDRPGVYFGVPLGNFAGWWVVSFFIFALGYGWAGLGRAESSRIPLGYELAWGVLHVALLALMGMGVFHRTGSGGPLWLAMAAMTPLSIPWLNRLHRRVRLRGRLFH